MGARRWGLLLLGAAALAALVFALRARASSRQRAASTGREAAADRPVPVVVAAVERRDVPLYLEGLGTATAYNTVVVRSRVEGRLDAVRFTEGQPVRRGDVLAEIDPRPFAIAVRQAEAVAARDRALVASNRRTLDRARGLLAERLGAQAEVDVALGAFEQSAAALRADEAQVAAARLSLDYARITSPIDGVAGLRQVDAGNVVRPGDASGIVVIRQVDPIAVVFTLPQDELPRLTAEMARGALPVEVFGRDGATRLGGGSLAVLDNQVQASTATLRLKAVLPNPARALWPDQFVRARLLLTTARGARVVPAAAIQRGPQGAFAYLVGADQRVSVRAIRVDRIEGEIALVADGLDAGDRVVVEGSSRLRAGARVQPRAASGEGDAATQPAGDGGTRGGRRGGRRGRDAGAPGAPGS